MNFRAEATYVLIWSVIVALLVAMVLAFVFARPQPREDLPVSQAVDEWPGDSVSFPAHLVMPPAIMPDSAHD